MIYLFFLIDMICCVYIYIIVQFIYGSTFLLFTLLVLYYCYYDLYVIFAFVNFVRVFGCVHVCVFCYCLFGLY